MEMKKSIQLVNQIKFFSESDSTSIDT